MLLYITNIPALFAMTVHHKTLKDLTTEEFYNYALHWFVILLYLMQEAIFLKHPRQYLSREFRHSPLLTVEAQE